MYFTCFKQMKESDKESKYMQSIWRVRIFEPNLVVNDFCSYAKCAVLMQVYSLPGAHFLELK